MTVLMFTKIFSTGKMWLVQNVGGRELKTGSNRFHICLCNKHDGTRVLKRLRLVYRVAGDGCRKWHQNGRTIRHVIATNALVDTTNALLRRLMLLYFLSLIVVSYKFENAKLLPNELLFISYIHFLLRNYFCVELSRVCTCNLNLVKDTQKMTSNVA